jgi:SAM-dependent methyltransferase
MLLGNQLQQAIFVAAKLGIADLLRDGPQPCDELAKVAGAHPGSLFRLLRALAAHGIFAQGEDGRFELTPLAEPLQSGTPQSVRSFALWSGGVSYQAFGRLEWSVRTGLPAFESLYGTEFFEYLEQDEGSGAIFREMMSRHTAPIARALSERDFSGVETIVDVGGGSGEVLAAILRAHPTMSGVLVERPRVLDQAQEFFQRAGVADRCTAVGGDIIDGVPPGDAYILKSVLHGLADEDAVRVLANCARQLPPAGVVLVIEFLIPNGNSFAPGKLMDLLMLVGCNGRERTAAEFGELFAAAGLTLQEVSPSKNGYDIVEGGPAARSSRRPTQGVVTTTASTR